MSMAIATKHATDALHFWAICDQAPDLALEEPKIDRFSKEVQGYCHRFAEILKDSSIHVHTTPPTANEFTLYAKDRHVVLLASKTVDAIRPFKDFKGFFIFGAPYQPCDKDSFAVLSIPRKQALEASIITLAEHDSTMEAQERCFFPRDELGKIFNLFGTSAEIMKKLQSLASMSYEREIRMVVDGQRIKHEINMESSANTVKWLKKLDCDEVTIEYFQENYLLMSFIVLVCYVWEAQCKDIFRGLSSSDIQKIHQYIDNNLHSFEYRVTLLHRLKHPELYDNPIFSNSSNDHSRHDILSHYDQEKTIFWLEEIGLRAEDVEQLKKRQVNMAQIFQMYSIDTLAACEISSDALERIYKEIDRSSHCFKTAEEWNRLKLRNPEIFEKCSAHLKKHGSSVEDLSK